MFVLDPTGRIASEVVLLIARGMSTKDIAGSYACRPTP